MNYGPENRAKPRVCVYRGWDPTQPTKNSTRAAVKRGVTVISGQVISLNSDNEWELGCVDGRVPYISIQDSADFDVRGSGVLTALSCVDKFEIGSAFFVEDSNYTEGAAITYDAATGNLRAVDLESESAEYILGYAVGLDPEDISETTSAIQFTQVLRFRTKYRGVAANLGLPAPASVEVTDTGDGTIDFSWPAVEGADGYEYQWEGDETWTDVGSSTSVSAVEIP